MKRTRISSVVAWGVRACGKGLVAILFTFGVGIASLVTASAHEVRPAYLELQEQKSGVFSVLFKTPMQGDARLALTAVLSGKVENITPIISRPTGDAMIQTWHLRAIEPLAGQKVLIRGLSSTMTDTLVRIEFADGDAWVERVTPGSPEATIPGTLSRWVTAATYLKLGIEHILLGFDHLLFVLALLIITEGTWRLVKTITAFTVAHSITLASGLGTGKHYYGCGHHRQGDG